MIVVTGSAGFIGRNLVELLNRNGFYELILVDSYDNSQPKKDSLKNLIYHITVDRSNFFSWAENNQEYVDFVFHLGARTDTMETDHKIFDHLNLDFSKKMWAFCSENDIPLLYASSAATFGNGSLGFKNGFEDVEKYQPLNQYAISKNEFDKWVKIQTSTPPRWAGFKFFNVYGPGESHKERMASVVWHSFNSVRKFGEMTLFKSHRSEFSDGQQARDFIHVSDVVEVCLKWMKDGYSGLFNLGTGKAETFNHLSECVFQSLGREKKVNWVETPEKIRDGYQYFTQADMSWMTKFKFSHSFIPLSEGINQYIDFLKTQGPSSDI